MSQQQQQQQPMRGGGGSFPPRSPAGPPPPYPQQQQQNHLVEQQQPYPQQQQQQQQQQQLQQQQSQNSYQPQLLQHQQYPPQQQQHQQQPPLTVAVPSHHQSQQHQPQQLTHAQLSPAVGTDTEQPKQQQQPSKQQQQHHVNLGFTPTPKMAQRHEKQQQQQQTSSASPRPLYQFQVTKLRSWRTGYVRLLALYQQEFATLDPDTLQETNRWSYHSIHEWQAMPKEPESMLLAVENNTKLKFSCHYVHRAHVLTALLQCRDNAITAAAATAAVAVGHYSTMPSSPPPPPQSQSYSNHKLTLTAQRYTRHGNSYSVQLHIKPYGLVETYGRQQQQQQHVLQTYKYTELRALSLTAEQQHGVVLHFWQPNKSRLYLIPPDKNAAILSGRDGRTELVRWVHDFAIRLGLELPLEESRTVPQWLQQRRDFPVGAVLATRWPVRKTTKRKDVAIVGPASGAVGGVVSRHLAITAAGYLVEQDGAGLVSCRKLIDLAALIRRQEEADQLTLEYVDGTRRTYASSSRDALCVSILDAAARGQNQNVAVLYVSDVPSDGYCLASLSRSPHNRAASSSSTSEDGTLSTSPSTLAASLFQPISIPVYILKRVYALATQTYAFVSSALDVLRSINDNTYEPADATANVDLVNECYSLVEACREFNASVLPTGEGLPSGPSDKTISGCLGALWGLVLGLLKASPTGEQEGRRDEAVAALLQTIYRLSRTLTGYKVSAELSTVQEAIPLLFQLIRDDFSRYWALQVIDVLLSGFPAKREMEVEYVNKNVLLKCGGHALVEGIVSSLVQARPQKRVSELILMAASNVLQSVLCSFHDTTSGEHFGAFIRALADRYHGLLSALQSQSPCVIENTALLLHLLSTHAPSTARAIRDEALSSAILLQHFYLATFSPMEGQRFLSRYLCSLWFSGPNECDEKRLLQRMVPHGFLTYLDMPPLSRVEEEQLDELERDATEENVPDSALRTIGGGASGTNTARLRSRIALAAATVEQKSRPENFRIFFHVLTQDHSLPDLIWSQQTRQELRIALESELAYVKREVEARGIDGIAWNHQQFRVHYPSLASEVKVGNVYMRLWLEAGDGFIRSWDEPLRLFEHLFRKFLCEIDRDEQVTNMVIRCMEKLYAVHAAKIGPFTDAMILVRKMSSTKSIETQHRLLRLLATILGVGKGKSSSTIAEIPENAEQLLNLESIGQLCQFVAWGHTDRRQMGNTLRQELGVDRIDDASCPPVWFIANTGKIPPPPETVRGPFRVSDLRRMMDEGDLSPYDLVTTAHVEEYDIDDFDPDTVKEDQIDTGKWKRLNEVWQLRWALCTDASGASILEPADVALLGLRALTRLVELHKSFDSRGVPYFPIPIAKRILSGVYMPAGADTDINPLAVLSQAILCNNAELVDQAAEILFKVTRHNERATQKLYLTGVFFFACSYTGSNFKALARLIHATHLEQHFRSGFAAAANELELPMKDRSILGQILPEGLLYVLVNYGPEKFAEVFVGSADTPEVLWTADMRKHLIEMIHQHLGDFPLRLFQNNSTEYEYCPMPGVAYKRLEKEIFCHNYYINNLCDEIRFPDWPIAEPVEVFRACLEHFKKQLDEDNSTGEDALEEARLLLKLNEGDGSKELRKNYRRLARVFHPDKNPSGRDTFEAIQKSYELLMPLLEGGEKIRVYAAASPAEGEDSGAEDRAQFGGSHMHSAELLIRAQLLICRRYERELSRYKYPAYPVILSCIVLPGACTDMVEKEDFQRIQQSAFVNTNIINFVRYAVELIFRTCLVSPLNAEELVGSGGIPILASLLSFYITAIRGGTCVESRNGSTANEADVGIRSILTFIVRTLAGVAFFENGRNAIKTLGICDRFILDLRGCMDDSLHGSCGATDEDTQMKRFTLECFANLAKDTVLQTQIIGAGAVWPLLKSVLSYDPTLETASVSRTDEGDGLGVSVASTNTIANIAVRVLGMLSGAIQDSPINEPFATALNRLLTPPIATMLRNRRTDEILKVLNSNVESADIIWSSEMRKQLQNYVNKKETDRPNKVILSLEDALESVDNFAYEALEDELRIGGIYVRVFNKTGKDALSRIPDPATFSAAIVNYIAQNLNASCLNGSNKIILPQAMRPEVELREDRFLLAAKSLLMLVQVSDVLDHALEESSTIIPAVLLSFLELSVDSEVFDTLSEILSIVSSRQAFAGAVARECVLWRLLRILERVDGSEQVEELSDGATTARYSKRKLLSWSVLEALSSDPQIAMQLVASSAWVELLGVLVGYSEFTKLMSARSGSAKTLSRLLWDPATGPRTVECLGRFLPPTLVVRLKDDPEAMLEVFDVDSESPELIWNGSMRAELRKALGKVLDDILAKGCDGDGKETNFTLPPSARARFPVLEAELYIGGVYVSRFLKEPTYSLRDPTTFLEHLLQRWVKELETFAVGGNKVVPATSNVLAKAEQDVLTTVTTAIVFVCKVRNTLCDKLSEWGYMSRALDLLEEVLDKELVGTPLLSVVRLLHVAAGRMANVEALAVVGQGDKRGVVGFLLRSINSNPLHEDSAFMIEALKIIFETALGDLKKVKQLKKAPQMEHQPGMASVAPSPAPGEGSVRKRVEGMHPLGEPFGTIPQSQPSISQPQQPTQQPVQQSRPGQPMSFVERQRQLMQSQQQPNALYGQYAPAAQQQTQSPLQQSVVGQQHGQFQNPPYGRQPPAVQQQPKFQQQSATNPDGQQTYPSTFSSPIPSHSTGMSPLARPDDLSRQSQQLYQQPHYQQQQQYGQHHAQTMNRFEVPHPVPSQSQSIYGHNQQQISFGQHYQPSMNTQGVSTLQSQDSLPSSQPNVTVTRGSDTRPSTTASPLTSHSQTMYNSSQGVSSLGYCPLPQPTQPLQQQQAQPQGLDAQHQVLYQPQHTGPVHQAQGPQLGDLYSQASPPMSAPPQPPMEGTGIDARQVQEDPKAKAEQQAMVSDGAPGAARGRVALLQQALACDLCEFLVNNVLENPNLSSVRDPDGAKVHSIALLKLLTKDPGFGPKFKLVLSGLPAWAKYKSQDHSLLITGHEQKADYFLTDGSSGEKKLLTAD